MSSEVPAPAEQNVPPSQTEAAASVATPSEPAATAEPTPKDSQKTEAEARLRQASEELQAAAEHAAEQGVDVIGIVGELFLGMMPPQLPEK